MKPQPVFGKKITIQNLDAFTGKEDFTTHTQFKTFDEAKQLQAIKVQSQETQFLKDNQTAAVEQADIDYKLMLQLRKKVSFTESNLSGFLHEN